METKTISAPRSGTAEYFRWRRARIKAGLPTRRNPYKLPASMRRYTREYMRQYRARKAGVAA